MLRQTLGNIEDVEGFVRLVLTAERNQHRLHGLLEISDEDEIVAEGVALLYELYEKWSPEKCELFSSYAMTFLPLRWIDWFRRELRQSCRGSFRGDRRGEYKMFEMVEMSQEDERDFRQTVRQNPSLITYGPDE